MIIRALVFLFVLVFSVPASAQSDADSILSRMSVEEKVGQLFTVYFRGADVGPELKSFITDQHIGGIIIYDAAGNVQTPAQVAQLNNNAQRVSLEANGIGLFVSVDQEGGRVARLRNGFTVMPPNMAVAATGNPDNARIAAKVMAEELKSVGINMTFSPAVDVNSNPDNPIIGVRSYGSSPEGVTSFALPAIKAYADAGIIAVAKHFPGHGDTGFDSHLRLPTVPHSRDHLDTVELAPFRAAIDAGIPAVMTAHVRVPALEPAEGIPATLSSKVLTGVLREDLNFPGLVITDSMGMGAISKNFGLAEAALMAFKAGADVLLYGADKGSKPSNFIPGYKRILSAVNTGEIQREQLDAAVRRILIAKQQFGIISPAFANAQAVATHADTPHNKILAEQIAQQSLVASGPLPQSSGSTLILWPTGKRNPTAEIKEMPKTVLMNYPSMLTESEITKLVSTAGKYDRIVVFLQKLSKKNGQAQLAKQFYNKHPKRSMAVLLESPYDLRLLPKRMPWLLAWSRTPASVTAVSQALSGQQTPKGIIPVKIPMITN